jgi:hypothetical protein
MSARPPTMEEDKRRAQLESYCGTVLDDYEDEVGGVLLLVLVLVLVL